MAKIPIEDSEDIDGPYLIFMCSFDSVSAYYYPEMFINICSRFMKADNKLRQNIHKII
jgi:hypothetical protein